MALRINYNFQAEFGHVNILKTERNLNTSLERLETGYRINSAKDDAAGLFIADQLNLVANALDQGVRNSQDGISAAQIAETTLSQIYDKLVSIYTKAEQAANDVNSSLSRTALQKDIDKLIDAIDRIASSAEFNGKKLLDGSFKDQYIHYGPRADQKLSISVDSARANDLAAYTLRLGGQSTSNATKGVASLVSQTDYEFATGSDTVEIQGVNIEGSLTTNTLTDAKAIADAINSNSQLQAKGIEASATNVSEASSWNNITVNGTGGLTIRFFVGPEKTADFTLTYAKGSTISLSQIIDDINAKAKANGLSLTATDGGGNLVLKTQGETVAVQIETTSGQTGISLGQFIQGATGSVGNASANATGSAVKVGNLDVIGANAYGYDFTGIAGAFKNLKTNATLSNSGSANKTSIKTDSKVDTNQNAEFTLKLINAVIKKVDKQRSDLGSIQINLETIIQNNEFSSVQQREAESRIRNVDFAKEMANFTRQQTLMQSGMAMLAQANQLPQLVLQLLR